MVHKIYEIKKNIKFSIIVPIYNSAKTLARCIESVINQSYDNFELLLIDDGSQDESNRIIQEKVLSDTRIKGISKKNEGLSLTRNLGIRISNGDYILFLDSDDFIDLDALKIINSKILSDDIDMLFCESFKITANENRIIGGYKHHKKITKVVSGKYLLKKKLFHVPATLYIYKRLFLLEHNIYFIPGIYHEDNQFIPRLLWEANKIILLPFKFYYNVVTEGSITQVFKIKRSIDLINTGIYYMEEKHFKEFNFGVKYGAKNVVQGITLLWMNDLILQEFCNGTDISMKNILKSLLLSKNIKYYILFLIIILKWEKLAIKILRRKR